MARRMSADSRAVLERLEKAPRTIDQLEAETGLDKKRLWYTLWNLRRLGWVTVAAVLKKSRWRVQVYGLMRRLPPVAREKLARRHSPPDHIAALNAAFRIGAPPARARGRTVRRR